MPVQCTCRRCGAEFAVVPAQVKRGKAKFCSKDCADAARRQHISCVCDYCGAPYAHRPSRANRGEQTFCSRACRGLASKVAPAESTCQGCGAAFTLADWRVRKGEGQFCSMACRDRGAHTARRDPPGIRLTSRYYGWSWREAQRLARERDGCCMDCGATPSDLGRALAVHHIVPFKHYGIRRHPEANALANLVALCQPCHIKREWATNWRRD